MYLSSTGITHAVFKSYSLLVCIFALQWKTDKIIWVVQHWTNRCSVYNASISYNIVQKLHSVSYDSRKKRDILEVC